MDKKLILNIILVVIGFVLIVTLSNGSLFKFITYLSGKGVDQSGLIFFYGDTCPHCKNVEDFMAKNKTEEKIKITKLEVYNNADNARLLVSKAKVCKLNTEQIGVPFLWNAENKSCLVGDVDIIKYLQGIK